MRSLLLLASLVLTPSVRAEEAPDPVDAHPSDEELADELEPDVGDPGPEPAWDDPGHTLALQLGDSDLRGLHFAVPPRVAPGAPISPTHLAAVAAHLAEGRPAAALASAEALAPTLRGRDAAAAWMAIGMLHRDAGRPNPAVDAFAQVRAAGGPLVPLAAWYEAEQELARDRPERALAGCASWLRRWPDGHHADDCAVLTAFAHARLGHADEALSAAAAYDRAHPKEPIGEQVALALADWEAGQAPARAAARLRRLATHFRSPLTGRLAAQGLAILAGRGVEGAYMPDDLASRRARSISLRESGRIDEAWSLFEELAGEADDDPGLAAWVQGELSTFGWRTRRYDVLAALYRERFAASGAPGDAWLLFRALDRGARYAEAAEVARDALDRFAGQRPWRGEEERVGRTMLLARAYDDARRLFDTRADATGNTGARNAFYAAFAAVMLDDRVDALRRLDAIAAANRGGLETEARYWRARLLDAAGEGAEDDVAWIRRHAPGSWYGLLLRSEDPTSVAHTGRWRGTPGELVAPTVPRTAPPFAGAIASAHLRPAAAGLAALSWPLPVATPVRADDEVLAVVDPCDPRGDYRACRFYAPDQAERDFDAFVARYADTWPDLLAVQDLARVGLHDLSGPLLARVHEAWRRQVRGRHTVAREVATRLGAAGWRPLFLHARDHHHVAKSTFGLARGLPDEERADVAALSLPLAHRRQVWRSGARYDVDPLLVLGVMRTESIYDANAISRAGARGPMQIMPRTGHLVADLTHDLGFHTGRLHDPDLAIDYGVRYLGLLMERFDGVFPLAVAAYNGGPHNVSAWLQGTGGDVPLDVFVEHIPFGETRRYVRAVTERYAAYVRLYDHGRVVVPPAPRSDRPEVVDF